MRRGVVIAFAVLGLAACGQNQNQGGATSAASSSEAAKPGEAAKPDVAAPANPDATSCLDLVGVGNYQAAVPVCTRALNADAANEKVKEALATANAKIAEMASKAAEGAAGAAAGATDAAEGAAKDVKDAAPTY